MVIGLSGGPDSVFLFHYLLELQKTYALTLIAAHLNHEWRAEADQEEQFCHKLAKKHGIAFVSRKMSDLNASHKYDGSKEAFARNMRRDFLESVCHDYHADAIALGHHAQDQQETFFIRLLRGASLSGLTAMQPKTGLYIRPLLNTSKKDILAYLNTHDLPFVIDQSNDSPVYLRNRIRTHLLPALKAIDNRFDASFAHTLSCLQETERYLELLTHTTYSEITTTPDNTTYLDTTLLHNQHPALQQRLIVHWLCQEQVPFPVTHTFLREILRFLQSPQGGTHTIHPAWRIEKKKKLARIITNK